MRERHSPKPSPRFEAANRTSIRQRQEDTEKDSEQENNVTERLIECKEKPILCESAANNV